MRSKFSVLKDEVGSGSGLSKNTAIPMSNTLITTIEIMTFLFIGSGFARKLISYSSSIVFQSTNGILQVCQSLFIRLMRNSFPEYVEVCI